MTKEEKKDEMKNRISMALKDPILQQGFEIICKNLKELEKENAELRAKESFVGDQNRKLCDQQQKIEVLEQENAELKEKLNFSTQYYQGEKAKEQLTKAKEIILRLYNAGRDVLMCRKEEKAYDNLSNAINDKSIEQFLKENA